jgi:hypothetical protein
MKISLAPDSIGFHTSTDGTTWETLLSRPREGFAGAPAIVAVGHGENADGPLEGYAYDSYYDDLVTARLPE